MVFSTNRKRARKLAPQALSALAIALSANSAVAADEESIYKFNGFGTLGLTHSSEKNADFAPNFRHRTGVGHTRSWSTDTDTNLGVQVSADFDNHWSAVLQVVTEQNFDNNYRPHVEWANIKYSFNRDLSVRAGRTAMPVYLFSDSRKVAYSIPWVRTATYFYNMVPISSSNGIDASFHSRVGEVSNTVTGLAAIRDSSSNSFKLDDGSPEGNKVEANSIYAVTDKIEWRDLILQLSYLRAVGTFPKLVAVPVPLISQLANHGLYTFKQIGLSYDPGNFFVLGEIAWDKAGFIGSRRGWYVSGGYRFGKFSPYVMHEKIAQTGESPGLVPNPALTSTAVGVRWDVIKNVAVKAQYDHLHMGPGAIGPMVNIQPNYVRGGKLRLLSFTVNFLF